MKSSSIDVPAKLIRFDLNFSNAKLNGVPKPDEAFDDAVFNNRKMPDSPQDHLLQCLLNAILWAANRHLGGHHCTHEHRRGIIAVVADRPHYIHGGDDSEKLAAGINNDGKSSFPGGKKPCRSLNPVIGPHDGNFGALRRQYVAYIHEDLPS
jgi:hypothetical protein